jgi:hypothetical protein
MKSDFILFLKAADHHMSGSRLQRHDISIFWQTLNGDDVKWCGVDYISLTVNYGNCRNETLVWLDGSADFIRR